jgi:queuine tRNA-ribosyltransferase
MEKHGGLHGFMGWQGADPHGLRRFPGFQPGNENYRGRRALRLAHQRRQAAAHAGRVDENSKKPEFRRGDGVRRVHGLPRTEKQAQKSMETEHALGRALEARARGQSERLFGIVQGSVFRESAGFFPEELQDIRFDGYAIGGLAVGETRPSVREFLPTPLRACRPTSRAT